jgi:hypothetical protein
VSGNRHHHLRFSPLVELLNIPPKDLWANSDMFYKQVTAERSKKEKLAMGGSMSPTAPTQVVVASRGELSVPVAKSPKKGKGTVGKSHRVAVPSGTNSPISVGKNDTINDD